MTRSCPTHRARLPTALRRHQPGLWTAAVQTHFAHPGNRFYPALLEAGIIEALIDPAAGMTDADRAAFLARGLGITNPCRARDGPRRRTLRAGTPHRRRASGRDRPTLGAAGGRGRRHHGIPDGVRRAEGDHEAPADRLAGGELWVVREPQRPQRP